MKQAQSRRIINYLATGKPLTPLMAMRRFGTMRLAARIKDLREDGHEIVTSRVKRGDAVVAEYRLAH